jgi:dTMP kinase
MDLGLSDDPEESFALFQAKILEQYDRAAEEYNLTIIDGTLPIGEQQRRMRNIVKPHLEGLLRRPEGAGVPVLALGEEA